MARLASWASVFESPFFNVPEQSEGGATTARIMDRHIKESCADVVGCAGFQREGLLHLIGGPTLYEGCFNLFPRAARHRRGQPVVNEIEICLQRFGRLYAA